MAGTNLELPKGITMQGELLYLTFFFNQKRYRVTTIYSYNTKNLKLVTQLLATIKIDLARDQFYLTNYARHLKRYDQLKELDTSYPPPNKTTQLLNDYLLDQLQRYETIYNNGNLSIATFHDYRGIIRNHLTPTFGDLSLNGLTIEHIEKFLLGLTLSRKRLFIVLIPLKVIYKREFKLGHINTNPFDLLDSQEISKYSAISTYLIEPFNTQEKELIINTAQGQFKNFIQFAFWTGMRIGEIIALTWDDIDFKKEAVSVTRSKTLMGLIKNPKTKAGIREVELTPLALEALKRQLKHTKDHVTGYIFHSPRTNKPRSSNTKIRYHWVKVLKQANVKYRNPHQMRHTFISHMLSLGNRPEVLYKMVGHENTEMIYKVYGKFINENKIGKILLT